MKKLILCIIIFFSTAIFKNANAQVSVNINIGSQPVWGPVGYDYAEYYYMPDMDMYYYVPRHQFVYLSNGNWVFSASLPARYRNYDLNNTYKVVINEPRAYLHYNVDRVRYSRYRGNHNQVIIRNSNEPKYYVVKVIPTTMVTMATLMDITKNMAAMDMVIMVMEMAMAMKKVMVMERGTGMIKASIN